MSGPVVFFHRSSLPNDYVLKSNLSRDSHARLAELAERKNIDLRFVLGEDSYKDGIFTNFWRFRNGEFINTRESFKAEMVYVKNLTKIFDTTNRVNNSFLENICIDKFLTAQTFPHLIKKTILINKNNLSQINELANDMVVLKPRYGAEGFNVHVLPKNEVTIDLLSDEEYIAQEFIDSSKGIPGLVEQRHEMRVYVFNDTIQSAYLRLPSSGSYLANIAQGAKEKQMENSRIPQSFISIVAEINRKFSDVTPRLYAIDIMNENGRPWVVEMNNTPGMPDVAVQPLTDNYLSSMLGLMVGKYTGGISLG